MREWLNLQCATFQRFISGHRTKQSIFISRHESKILRFFLWYSEILFMYWHIPVYRYFILNRYIVYQDFIKSTSINERFFNESRLLCLVEATLRKRNMAASSSEEANQDVRYKLSRVNPHYQQICRWFNGFVALAEMAKTSRKFTLSQHNSSVQLSWQPKLSIFQSCER